MEAPLNTVKRPGGARPLPSRTGTPLKLSIPQGNVRMIVDQNNQGGWQQASESLPCIPTKSHPTPPPSTRPSLKLSMNSAPAPGPPPKGSTSPSPGRPKLSLHTSNGSQKSTPSLSLAIPTLSQPHDNDNGQDWHAGPSYSALRTPIPGEGDDSTLLARPAYSGEESSYGYGGSYGGSFSGGQNSSGQRTIKSMTEDIKAAMSMSGLSLNDKAERVRSRSSSILDSTLDGSAPSHYMASGPQSVSTVEPSPVTPEDIDAVEADNAELLTAGLGPEDLEELGYLGEGSGGAVMKVRSKKNGAIMAKKVIARTANPLEHRQILRELRYLNACSSPNIVRHFGSFLSDHDTQICILMEYCEAGSLDSLMQRLIERGARSSEHVLGRIASAVLRGLDYMHEKKVVHRDIKPSNILMTRLGVVKLCDFGVSGELVNSVAGTFTGTQYYMAPERAMGEGYSITSDVWSLGITLHEFAFLKYPFQPPPRNPIEAITCITRSPIPQMEDGDVKWSDNIKDFMSKCLIRAKAERPYPRDMLKHPFITISEAKKVNMARWVSQLCGWPYEP